MRRVSEPRSSSHRRSPASLYDYNLATYDADDVFDQSLAKGFVELWGMPTRIAARRDQRLETGRDQRLAGE